jgi:uncharacterized protein YbjT (DUF2867 family)
MSVSSSVSHVDLVTGGSGGMGSADPVLVVGAAGPAAGEVVRALAARGVIVRGLVRSPDEADGVRRRGAAEVIVGDLHDPASVEAALDGVASVFYLAPAFMTDEAATGQALIAAAVKAGVRRLVFSSVIHPVLRLVNHAAKAPVEAALYDSGLEHTVLQPALFFQNYATSWSSVLESGVLAEPWSATTRFSRVDYRDVAEAAAIALTGDRLLGGTYELASEGHLDRHEVAALISDVTGRRVRAERVDPRQLTDSPPPLRAMFDHYDNHGILSNAVTLTAVLGREPRSLRHYFEELAGPEALR